ncbi:hypothetical protein VTJ49DRAFT_2760 [Mycothermus thermophilus]|uniref:PNPLA domain-containing protein n=1 Tax=Humicola insolens TaxID=85995 RepID=A0ABR3VMS4_HUMIN
MSLCDRCNAIDLAEILAKSIPPNAQSLPENWLHSESVTRLRSSAVTCELCAILLGDAHTNRLVWPRVCDDDCVRLETFTRASWPRASAPWQCPIPISGFRVKIGPWGSKYLHCVRRVDLCVSDNSPGILKKLISPRPVSQTWDPRILRRWLDACVHNHVPCRIPTSELDMTQDEEPPELPTRVIDVGSADPLRHPVLVESQGRKGRYIALSHCWGPTTAHITKTERSNKQRRMQSIPLDDLSTNFRHAIEVTRALGFRYLWIDSLCIVQDDSQDWAAESVKMAEVYSRAALTIAAANSASADEGFLKPRRSPRTIKLPFRNGSPRVLMGHFMVAEPTPEDAQNQQDHYLVETDGSPLSKRGWTVQERLLSRRIVFFGEGQMHWECGSARWSESTRMQPIQYLEQSAPGLVALRTLPKFGSSPTKDPFKLLNDWYRILNVFAQRELTKKEDKLPALSGIAKVVRQGFGGGLDTTYRAGLWTHDLPRALLWTTFAPDAGSGAPLPGPSWSWISRDAAIYSATEEEAVPDILGVSWENIVLNGADPYGQVKQGTLVFTGHLKLVSSIEPIQRAPRVVRLDSYPLSDARLYDSQAQKIGSAVLDEPSDDTVFCRPLYAVPIRHTVANRQPGGFNIPQVQALLLQKRGDGTFRRVGVAYMRSDLGDKARRKDAPISMPFQVLFGDTPMATSSSSNPHLRVLCLDGGGVRGLSSLYILERLLYQMKPENDPKKRLKPCDVFDVIVGTSTGGLIAIMLGVLEMDIQSCIEAYTTLAQDIFTPRARTKLGGAFAHKLMGSATFSAQKLEDGIRKVIRENCSHMSTGNRAAPEDMPMLGSGRKCKVFVCTVLENRASYRIRNYQSRTEPGLPMTITQACRATTAAPTFFDPLRLGNMTTLRDGALGNNNPIMELMQELQTEFGYRDTDIACIVSIGTGVSQTEFLRDDLVSVAKACAKIATDTQATESRFRGIYATPGRHLHGRYFRFEVEQGLQQVGMEEWRVMRNIWSFTTAYLNSPVRRDLLARCAALLSSGVAR